MTCVCIGGGGGCSVKNTTAPEYVAAFGFLWNPADPNLPAYQEIASEHVPAGQGNVTAWEQLAIACMVSRALLYCKSQPGDCGTSKDTISTNPGLVQAGGGLAIQAGTDIAEALGVAGSTLAPATLGASVILSTIVAIFTHHAQAEAAQENALCTLCPKATQAILNIDTMVKAGQISPATGVQALQSIAAQFKQSVSSLTKTCNAFCGYSAILDCMAAQGQYLYAAWTAAGQAGSPVPGLSTDELEWVIGGAVVGGVAGAIA